MPIAVPIGKVNKESAAQGWHTQENLRRLAANTKPPAMKSKPINTPLMTAVSAATPSLRTSGEKISAPNMSQLMPMICLCILFIRL